MKKILFLVMFLYASTTLAHNVSCNAPTGERVIITGNSGELLVDGVLYSFDATSFDGNNLFQSVSGGPVKAFTFSKNAKKLRYLKRGWITREGLSCR